MQLTSRDSNTKRSISMSIYIDSSKESQENSQKHIPYCYLVGWSQLGKYYYGRRTAQNCDPSEFWTKYFTSSPIVKEYRKKYGEPDIIQIRKTFEGDKRILECCAWECKVLSRIHAARNEKFLNRTNGDLKWDYTGRKRSPEAIEKGRLKLIGREFTKEHCENMSKAHKGKQTGESNPTYFLYSKYYYVKLPSGEIIEIYNLKKYCRDNKLNHAGMSLTATKKKNHHKGHQVRFKDPERFYPFYTDEELFREYIILSPEGIEYRCDTLYKFCKEHGLNSATLSTVFTGKRKHHKGWQVRLKSNWFDFYPIDELYRKREND